MFSWKTKIKNPLKTNKTEKKTSKKGKTNSLETTRYRALHYMGRPPRAFENLSATDLSKRSVSLLRFFPSLNLSPSCRRLARVRLHRRRRAPRPPAVAAHRDRLPPSASAACRRAPRPPAAAHLDRLPPPPPPPSRRFPPSAFSTMLRLRPSALTPRQP